MPKKRAQVNLPPLSLEVLESVESTERFAQSALRGCERAYDFNRDKASRILRTCVVETFEVQFSYYSSLPNYDPHWLPEMIENTVSPIVGLVAAAHFDRAEARIELRKVVLDYLEQRAEPAVNANESQTIGTQLGKLQAECRLTVEELAEAVSIAPRSVYRHLSGEAMPRVRQKRSYEQFFSRKLKREIKIETSSKRQ